MQLQYSDRKPGRAKSLLMMLLLCSTAASAAPPVTTVTLATSPLANSSTTVVKPNIMFTLDDSGSMDWPFLPDWASANQSTPSLHRNAGYNGVAYNPAIIYVRPVFFDANGSLNTTTYPTQTGTSASTGADTGSTLPNWQEVKNDAYGVQSSGTSNLTNAYSYTFVAGEYCTTPQLTSCTAATAPTGTHPFPAYVRWCTDTGLTNCRALYNSGTYRRLRYPGMGTSTSTITISGGASKSVSSIIINGHQILSGATLASSDNTTVASRVANAINNCDNSLSGNCTIFGYTATYNNNRVYITSPSSGVAFTPAVTISAGSVSATAFSGTTTPGFNLHNPIYTDTNNFPGTNAKHPNRTDCLDTSCTYAEEMTNYANWHTYYRTRMQAMKTSVSRAFRVLDQGYRVGFNSISYTGADTAVNRYLDMGTFELAHKRDWYTKLFAGDPSSSTPLRAAISKVGRIFANKLSGATDPVQYSCQQNFSILSTDGYWNTGYETTSYGPYKVNSNTSVGNLDGGTTPLPMKEGSTTSNTLADVAKYYYDTDLRTSTLGNCSGALGNDVCENNVFTSNSDTNTKQHVTQFTMGLGIDGTLNYQNDYATATSGDYYDLKNGLNSKFWPDPIANTNEARIDDLWHAAVNGRGSYFSAKDPDSIVRGFTEALTAIKSKVGAGAAAATSTLNPVAGDNSAYVASYTTVKWQGNLESRVIDITTGEVSESATWCVENVLPNTCTAPAVVEESSTPSGIVYNCVTANATSCDDGTLRGDGSCAVPIATTCTGTLATKVDALSDTRTIYMANAAGNGLIDFNYSNIDLNDQENYFNEAYLTGKLSQLVDYTVGQKTEAMGENLVKFLRGQTGYEDRTTNISAGRSGVYRFRATTLGDITESQPVFVGKPVFKYSDTDYLDFVTAQANRAKTIYVGSNDGMLHAFDAATGNERWAFVPTAVIPNLWALADKLYSGKHTNYVNGEPVVGDVFDGTNWRTILVAGLNGGGRSYYALDITNPNAPALLWEINSTIEPNLGYSYGPPVITKRSDGTWVVLLTSGYNNVSPGDGKGYLFVRDAITGATVKTIGTAVGSAAVPSGLSKISNWADAGNVNNTSQYVYGGDLMGNLWRIDINAATNTAMQFAVLKDSLGITQPITAAPELGTINTKRVIFVGTGKYLEALDLSDTQVQTIYAIKDDNAVTTFVNPRTALVQQTLTLEASGSERTSSENAVDFFTGRGWFIDFPDAGERVHVNPKLDAGTLFVPTTVPSNTACSPGGYGWFNYFDYKNGWASRGAEGNYVSQKTNAPIVGFNVYYLSSGERIVGIVTADGPTPKKPGKKIGEGGAGNNFSGIRVMWREILTP